MFPPEIWTRIMEWVDEDSATLGALVQVSHIIRELVYDLRPMSHPHRFLWLARHGFLRREHLPGRLLGRARASPALRMVAVKSGCPETIRLICGQPRRSGLPWLWRERLRVRAGRRETTMDQAQRLAHRWTVQEVLWTGNYGVLRESEDRMWWSWDRGTDVVNVHQTLVTGVGVGYPRYSLYRGSYNHGGLDRARKPIPEGIRKVQLPPVIDVESLWKVWQASPELAADVLERFVVCVYGVYPQTRMPGFAEFLRDRAGKRPRFRAVGLDGCEYYTLNYVTSWDRVRVLLMAHGLEPPEKYARESILPNYSCRDLVQFVYPGRTPRMPTDPEAVEWLISARYFDSRYAVNPSVVQLDRQLAHVMYPDLVRRVMPDVWKQSSLEMALRINPEFLVQFPDTEVMIADMCSSCSPASESDERPSCIRDFRVIKNMETLQRVMANGSYSESDCVVCYIMRDARFRYLGQSSYNPDWAPRCRGYGWVLTHMLELHGETASMLLAEWWRNTARAGQVKSPNEYERQALIRAGYIHYGSLPVFRN